MDRHHLRRAILTAVRDLDPAPAGIDDIAGHPVISMAAVPRDSLAAAVRGLVSHGYLRDMRPGREPLVRPTPAGTDQIDREADLDEYVWGRFASKFAE